MDLVKHTQESLEKTLAGETRLPESVYSLEGMSGRLGRTFLNHLNNFPTVSYLEIGCCKGSTLVAATYDNNRGGAKFVAIDNFSQFGGTYDHIIFLRNRFKDNLNFDIYAADCWGFDQSLLTIPINVYFFDGPHGYEDHRKAITHYAPTLTPQSIIVVDDWNDSSNAVQSGTRDGIADAGLKILWEKEVGHDKDSDHGGWWNGFGIFVVEK